MHFPPKHISQETLPYKSFYSMKLVFTTPSRMFTSKVIPTACLNVLHIIAKKPKFTDVFHAVSTPPPPPPPPPPPMWHMVFHALVHP